LTLRYTFYLFFITGTLISFGQDPYLLSKNSEEEFKENLIPYVYCNNSAVLFTDTVLLVNRKHRLYFKIKNTTNHPLTRVVSFGEKYLCVQYLEIESSLDKEKKLKFDLVNHFVIKIQSNETQTVSFTVKELNKKDVNMISVFLLSEKLYLRYENIGSNFRPFFLGLLGFLCLFNFILFVMTRWKVYLKYSLYIFTAFLYFSYYYGVFQYLFPNVKSFSSNYIHIWYNLMFIAYFIFINDFGEYKKYVPRAYFLLNIGLLYKFIQTIFNAICHSVGAEFIYSNTYISIAMVFELILMGFVVFYILKNKRLMGRVVIIASLLMTVGGLLDQLIIFGVTPQFYYVEIAIILELLTFSLGLGLVSRQYYQDKISAQYLYIEQMKENEKMKSTFTNQLEKKIKLRTLELEEKNQENELLLGEVHHRVKNSLQIISSMLSLQRHNVSDLKAKSALLESKERIKSIMLIHKMLYQNDSFIGIDMNDFTYKLVEELMLTFGVDRNKLELKIDMSKLNVNVDIAIPLGLILDELLINSFKYAYPNSLNPKLKVSLKEENGLLVLIVWDNGNAKEEHLKKYTSFGMKLIKSLTRQTGGKLTFDDTEGLKVMLTINDYKTI